jgi:hypothetical protein
MADHAANAPDEEEPPVLLDRAARATRGKRWLACSSLALPLNLSSQFLRCLLASIAG